MDLQRISFLESSVVDRIAAGEVVERPAHLVKELIENSLDAGASEIQIEIQNGGRSVTITDNGVGIHPEDLSKALARHATSKIRSSDDLWRLQSYGFRGEALASIASVAKLSLSSRPGAHELGHEVVAEFGEISKPHAIGHAPGTRVQVRDLFENVPARLKFLKSSAAEIAQIKSVVKAMALGRPECGFRLSLEGELEFIFSATKSRVERVQAVLGVSPLYEGFARREDNGVFVEATAIFADPHHVAKTNKNIWLFAQGRWVQDRGLQAAVLEAYKNLLMHGESPICAVWVKTSPENIDVNIHPTKSQVKFVDSSLAFRAVRASLRESLELAPWLERTQAPRKAVSPVRETASAVPQESLFAERTQYQQKITLSDLQKMGIVREQVLRQEPLAEQKTPSQKHGSQLHGSQLHGSQLRWSQLRWSQLQVLGQAHLTYLLCQSDEGLVLIDQHAAHERVQFEKLMAAWTGKTGASPDVQEFLFPITFSMQEELAEALIREQASFAKMGLSLALSLSTEISLSSAPSSLKEQAVVKALEKAAQDLLDQGGSQKIEDVIADFCALAACHSSVRAGQALSIDESRALLEQMDEFPLSSFCPHGRPVSVQFSLAFLEREFGRRP